MNDFDVLIIGDGFTSLLTAANLARAEPRPRIGVIGRSVDWGPGLAFGRCHAHHLLNVPAAHMGAFPEKPDDFLRWLEANVDAKILKSFEEPDRPLPRAFVPRRLYGEHLREIAWKTLPLVTYINDTVNAISKDENIFTTTGNIDTYRAEKIVLATGVPPSAQKNNDEIDPWDFDFEVLKNSSQNVTIIGTGLTMVDIISTLENIHFKGKITAISRRGLLPAAHGENDAASVAAPFADDFLPLTGSLPQKMKNFRTNIRLLAKHGVAWQAYFNLIRPHISELWQHLSAEEQRVFIKKILPYWNVLRHRQPQKTRAMLDRLISEGQLKVTTIKSKTGKSSYTFNCRGPDYSFASVPLIDGLLKKNLLRRHQNGMGIEVDHMLCAFEENGERKIFIPGMLSAGNFLEATAVPDLRRQCATVASALLSRP